MTARQDQLIALYAAVNAAKAAAQIAVKAAETAEAAMQAALKAAEVAAKTAPSGMASRFRDEPTPAEPAQHHDVPLCYTVKQFRQKVTMSNSTFYNLVKHKQIRVVKIGRRTLVPHSEAVRLATLGIPQA
jgi:hypothetical protein